MDLWYALGFFVGGFLIGRLTSSKVLSTRNLYEILAETFKDRPDLVEKVFIKYCEKFRISLELQRDFIENHRIYFITRKLLRGEAEIKDGKIIFKNKNDSSFQTYNKLCG